MIHSRVVWMLRPVERSITVSAPQRIAHTIFSTSSSTEEVTAELPILALILVRKLRPMIFGAHELRRDEGGDGAAELLAVIKRGLGALQLLLAAEVLALGDVDHLFCND